MKNVIKKIIKLSIFFALVAGNIVAQNRTFQLLEQRLDDLREESESLEKQRNELSEKVESLKKENQKLKSARLTSKKEIENNEAKLTESIKKLYDSQNNLTLKIAEVLVLSKQVVLLKNSKDSLSTQLKELKVTNELLEKSLSKVQSRLDSIQREYEEIAGSAKSESLESSLSNPRGYRPKKFSIFLCDGGFNLGQGFSVNVSTYTYLVPTKSIILGFILGYDNYSEKLDITQENFSLVPVAISWRGTFNGKDFFRFPKDPESIRFNMYYTLSAGGAFTIRDTEPSKNKNGNVLFNLGLGVARPLSKTVAFSLTASLGSQRLLISDTNNKKTGDNRFMLAVKAGFFFKK